MNGDSIRKFAEWCEQLADRLSRLAQSDNAPVERTREIVTDAVEWCFVGSQDPEGNPWKKLVWRVGKPLILTGLLMRSALEATRRTSVTPTRVYSVLEADNTPFFYAKFHQFGTSRIPARPFFGLGDDDIVKVADAYGDWATKMVLGIDFDGSF